MHNSNKPRTMRSLRMSDAEWADITAAAEREAAPDRSAWIRSTLAKAALRSKRKAARCLGWLVVVDEVTP